MMYFNTTYIVNRVKKLWNNQIFLESCKYKYLKHLVVNLIVIVLKSFK